MEKLKTLWYVKYTSFRKQWIKCNECACFENRAKTKLKQKLLVIFMLSSVKMIWLNSMEIFFHLIALAWLSVKKKENKWLINKMRSTFSLYATEFRVWHRWKGQFAMFMLLFIINNPFAHENIYTRFYSIWVIEM